jgi:hypothetical protein
MMKLRSAAVISGLVSVAIAALGIFLLISQPAQSKDDKSKPEDKGVTTSLGF